MAYPNYFGYQNPYYQPMQDMNSRFQANPMPHPAPMPQQNNGILWVQGEEAAKSYMVTPGSSVLLMDSDAERFYIKSVDNSGIPQPLRVFEYKERMNNGHRSAPAAVSGSAGDPVTREEFNALATLVAKLSEKNEED